MAALEAVYRERYGIFVRVAAAITADAGAAEDVVHETFVQAVRHRRRVRDAHSLDGWLWRILVNEARKRRAAERRLVALESEHEGGAMENGRGDDVRALVAALPERQRHALFLRYYADLDYAAIATALGMSPGTVAATLNAARRALRRQLTEVER